MAQRYHFSLLISHFSFKRYPLSLLCLALIFILSFTPFFPETPFDEVQFIDKWTHLVMYGGTTSVMWWEHLRHCKKEARRPILQALFWFAVVGMTLLGGLMELLQAYCTSTRSGEWLDFFADTIGVILGTIIGLILKKLQSL
jgi:VanZ family protein